MPTPDDPEDSAARWELLMTTFYLRAQGEDVGKSYSEFRKEFDHHIAYVDADNADGRRSAYIMFPHSHALTVTLGRRRTNRQES
jgi:hypothetical protein